MRFVPGRHYDRIAQSLGAGLNCEADLQKFFTVTSS